MSKNVATFSCCSKSMIFKNHCSSFEIEIKGLMILNIHKHGYGGNIPNMLLLLKNLYLNFPFQVTVLFFFACEGFP